MSPDHLKIQNLLCQHPDGLMVKEIAQALQMPLARVYEKAASCPGIYVDRWYQRDGRGAPAAVYCIGSHENCPRPAKFLLPRVYKKKARP